MQNSLSLSFQFLKVRLALYTDKNIRVNQNCSSAHLFLNWLCLKDMLFFCCFTFPAILLIDTFDICVMQSAVVCNYLDVHEIVGLSKS